jgi:predicted DNA-binding transcriptional regulator YafY
MTIPHHAAMRRTDRLYDLIQILRDGRLHRAGEMATILGVSERTIWRDMATLTASGMPLEGERGVGYILRSPITLPPMILSAVELAALRAGLRHVADGPDASLARAARGIAAKVAAVTPILGTEDPLDAPTRDTPRAMPLLPILRAAVRGRERLAITYLDARGHQTHRDIRPLQLGFWGRVWSLTAWCDAQGFQQFRVDRILAADPTGEVFADDPGKTLEDHAAQHEDDDEPRQRP